MSRYHVMLVNAPAEVTGIPIETLQKARVGDLFTLSGGPDEEIVQFDIMAIDDSDPEHTIIWVSHRAPPQR